MAKTKPMTNINVRISPELLQSLKEIANVKDITISQMVRQMVREVVRSHGEKASR